MRSAYGTAPSLDAAAVRRRSSGFGLALAINLGLLLVLMKLGFVPLDPEPAADPILVTLEPQDQKAAPAPSKAPRKAPTKPLPLNVPPPKIQLPPMAKAPLDMVVVTKEEYAASDIAKLPSASAIDGGSAGDSKQAGVGPNGQTLYAAEWARRPTATELAAYLPRNMPAEGWGLIACRTIPERRVTDCVELESYPRTSYLARSVRNAAWQFRVRPPRKDGKEMVGEWVSIRIDYVPR